MPVLGNMDVRDAQVHDGLRSLLEALVSVNRALPLPSGTRDAPQQHLAICAWFWQWENKATIKGRAPAASPPAGHDDGMEVSR